MPKRLWPHSEVKTAETKKGDFGGDEKCINYDVKEYRIVDHNHQEKIFNYHGLLASQTMKKAINKLRL